MRKICIEPSNFRTSDLERRRGTDIRPSVNPLKNRETQHANIVLQCMDRYFEQPNMKGNHALIEW
jgi:hypothetical protein